jgi:hypothetical protein
MGRKLAVLLLPTVGCLAVAAAASAIRLRPPANCPRGGVGNVSLDGKWQTAGPLLISISHRAAANIARRAGSFEGHQEPPRIIPCDVAESVSIRGMNAWTHWTGNDGWVGVGLLGPTGKPYLGRFYCVGKSTNSHGAVETCEHRANQHAGHIVVRFAIEPYIG